MPSGAPPPGFEPATPTLEDAYLVLMRASGGANGDPTAAPLAGSRAARGGRR